MRNFKDSYKGQTKVKERKNRPAKANPFFYTYFLRFRYDPEFMSEDRAFNIDAELEADFVLV